MSELDLSLEDLVHGDNTMKTTLPGVEVTTSLADAEPEVLESLHRAQLTFALEHAETAKEASRM